MCRLGVVLWCCEESATSWPRLVHAVVQGQISEEKMHSFLRNASLSNLSPARAWNQLKNSADIDGTV